MSFQKLLALLFVTFVAFACFSKATLLGALKPLNGDFGGHIDLVDNEQSAYEFGRKMGFKQATKLRLNQALKDDVRTGHFKTFLDTFIRR
ncbi:unnamed protein product [Notodromas monacha]|uniref:Uncharacterized protein n=1 Tax=Notodromas monacha TaxID=399045 RepID=A0A7R9BWT6_9CRUS|nr:unnamed protein product [Notodromas monacha]CAG0922106.1 unnamed protein product [Notodromas monacha]